MDQRKLKNGDKRPGVQITKEPSTPWLWLVPDLKKFRPIEQSGVLSRAKSEALQPLEVVAIVVWLVFVTLLAKFILEKADMTDDIFFTVTLNLIFTVPMICLLFVPLHVRRLRRGVLGQLQKKD